MRKVLFVLGELSDGDVDWLVSVGKRQTLSPGAVLLREQQPAEALYIVLDGELAVTVSRPTPRELSRISCGEIAGELSFLDARPPSATVTASEHSLVLAVPRGLLSARLASDLGFAARFYKALGVLLAYRLRNNVTLFEGGSLGEEGVYDDELQPDFLDSVARAGARFDWMLRRIGGQ
jgi:bacteriocin-type transport-associated protein